jgi:hypothetical protein
MQQLLKYRDKERYQRPDIGTGTGSVSFVNLDFDF